MNCLTARQTLELYRPAESDEAQRDAAVRHFDDCPACQDAVRRQERFDLDIGRICRDVPVPDDLKERLLACLKPEPVAAGEPAAVGPTRETQPAAEPGARSASRWKRRRVMATVLVTAGLVAAGLSVWFVVFEARGNVHVDEVVQLVLADGHDLLDLPAFTSFSREVPLALPATMDTRWLVTPPRQPSGQDAAVYRFSVNLAGRKLKGCLIVIPRRFVRDGLPVATSFPSFPGQAVYKHGYCTTSWVEGEFVYVCCLSGGEDDLLRLAPPRNPPA
jgi:hypothetical protein